MTPYERFEAWQLSHQLVKAVYNATKVFPRDERYGLTAQARRAACSAAVNIVEGSAKRGPNEFRRYLDISIGSLAELDYTLRLAAELGLLPQEVWIQLRELHIRASQVTWKLY